MRKRKKSKNSSEIKDLKKEINYLRAENAYLKKLRALVLKKQETITVQMKTQMVNELRPQYPLCLLLGIAKLPRSTYYYNIEILKRPDQDAKWKKLIQSIFDKHEGRYGYRRICDTLKNLGYTINHKKVQRIMNELGLKCKVRIKKYRSYKGPVGKKANNILNRDFSANRPNEKWVTDITEFKLFGEKFYLSPVLDLFNGEIISYTIRNRPTYSLVGDMLDQALNRLSNKDQLLMHSDQGWHYRMERFRQTLKKQGITQSMSRKGNCFDNAVIENFFGILKTEFIHYKTFRSEQHFLNELNKYINYYNHERIKSRLNRMSPVQYRTHYEQQIV